MSAAAAVFLVAFRCGSGLGAGAAPATSKPVFQGLFRGTPQEQAACSPDADKFCKAMGSDELRVLSCLQRNRQQISAACRRVLESHGQ